jgi:hypothetical protein
LIGSIFQSSKQDANTVTTALFCRMRGYKKVTRQQNKVLFYVFEPTFLEPIKPASGG